MEELEFEVVVGVVVGVGAGDIDYASHLGIFSRSVSRKS